MQELKERKFQRILVVKLSAMGDNVMSTPVARGLRELYPDATIDWLVEPLSEDILTGNPHLNNVIVWDRKHSYRVTGLRGLVGFFRDLRELRGRLHGRYDLAIDLQGLARSALAMVASGAPVRVGDVTAREGSRMFYTHISHIEDRTHRCSASYSEVLRTFGHPNPPMDMEVFPSEENRARADALLDGLAPPGGLVSIACATTRPYKHWTNEAFARTLDLLYDECGMVGVIHGAPGDRDMARRIADLCQRQKPLIVAGQTTLRDAAEIIRRSRLLVGVDTGLTHVAIAVKTPTIFVYGPNDPARLYKEPGVRVVQKSGPRQTPRRLWWDDRSIDLNTPDDVLAAVRDLLPASPEAARP